MLVMVAAYSLDRLQLVKVMYNYVYMFSNTKYFALELH